MPTIYRQYCERCDCDRETDVTYDGFAGAVITSGERGGTIITGHYLAYLDADESLVTLPHPIEDSALTAQGGTWFNATINGRLFQVTNLICKHCGTVNPSPRLHCFTGFGCLTGIALAIITFILLKQLTPIPPQFLGFPAIIAVFVPDFLLTRWLRFRHRHRISQLAFKQCGNCGSSDAISVYNCKSEPVMCPKCQQKFMHISIAGRS